MNKTFKNIQDIIQQLLEEKSMSQEQLAEVLGVNQTTVSQWVRGLKKPGYDSIKSIYDNFGITPNEIFGIEK